MYYLANFAKKPLPVKKVINNWIKKTKSVGDDSVLRQQRAILTQMNALSNPDDIQVLAKQYTDSAGRKRKVATGIADIQASKSGNTVKVNYITGNPRARREGRFKGAVDSLGQLLRERYTTRTVTLNPTNKKVQDLYISKIGVKPTSEGLRGTIR
jgi:hypothetical protein